MEKKLSDKNNIRIYYVHSLKREDLTKNFRLPKNIADHEGIISIASVKQGEGTYNIGISFCSPSDKFDKTKAHYIAIGRAIKFPITITPEKFKTKETILDILRSPDKFPMPSKAKRRFPKTISKFSWYHDLVNKDHVHIQ